MSDNIYNSYVIEGECVRITADFEYHIKYGNWARGIDLVSEIEDAAITAYKAGTVLYAGDGDGYGLCVFLNHDNNLVSVYGHLKQLNVSTGDIVKAGDKLGIVGSTGNSTGVHLHFSLRDYPVCEPKYLGSFWADGGMNDTKYFSWIDPESYVLYNPIPVMAENRYKVINISDIQIGAFTNYSRACDVAQVNKAYVYDSLTDDIKADYREYPKLESDTVTLEKLAASTLEYVIDHNVLDDDVKIALEVAIKKLRG